ncbi:MAG TPA: hypothetical protein ACFCUC_14825 [Desulfobacterales bacterium]
MGIGFLYIQTELVIVEVFWKFETLNLGTKMNISIQEEIGAPAEGVGDTAGAAPGEPSAGWPGGFAAGPATLTIG